MSGYSLLELVSVFIFIAGIVMACVNKKWLYVWAGLYVAMLLMAIDGREMYYTSFQQKVESIVSVGVIYPLIVLGGYAIYNKQQRKKLEKIQHYQETSYFQQTNNSYDEVMGSDLGKYGEFLVFDDLRELEGNGSRFLFNTYIPLANGKTSEIDVIIIDRSGLYVIESKNYSGWIFGTENIDRWMQVLKGGTKNRFYNPVKQNRTHCKYLADYLSLPSSIIHSYIVFSNRCEFKEIPYSDDYLVIHRDELLTNIKNDIEKNGEIFDDEEVAEIFKTLFPLTQVGDDIKKQHIDDVSRMH